MKRDYRLLVTFAFFVTAAGLGIYDYLDMVEYEFAYSHENWSYFEDRFDAKKPENCFDCWPPLRPSLDYIWASSYLVGIAILLFAWWRPKK